MEIKDYLKLPYSRILIPEDIGYSFVRNNQEIPIVANFIEIYSKEMDFVALWTTGTIGSCPKTFQ